MTRDPGTADDEVVVVAPSLPRAAGWTILGSVAIGLSGWTLATSSATEVGLVASAVLMASVAVTVLFAVQVFAPGAWTLRLGDGAVRGHCVGLPVDVELADVQRLEVRRLLGDRTLVVETRWRRRRLLLPVGADVAAIERIASDHVAARPGRRLQGTDPALDEVDRGVDGHDGGPRHPG